MDKAELAHPGASVPCGAFGVLGVSSHENLKQTVADLSYGTPCPQIRESRGRVPLRCPCTFASQAHDLGSQGLTTLIVTATVSEEPLD